MQSSELFFSSGDSCFCEFLCTTAEKEAEDEKRGYNKESTRTERTSHHYSNEL